MKAKPSNETIYALLLEFKGTLNEIKNQAIKTNGRVNTLETRQDKLDGAISVIKVFIIPIIISIILMIIDIYI